MLSLPLALAVALVVCLAVAQPVHAGDPALETETDRILYALGFAVSQSVTPFQLTAEELKVVQSGFADAVLGNDPRVVMETVGPQIDTYLQQRMGEVAEREKAEGTAFQAKMAAEEGAETTDSGLIYRELKAGTGASPVATDTVKIDYKGTLSDGSVFDSSTEGPSPAPATFPLNRVIGCFGEGVQRMKVGGTSKLTCPPEIAYGDKGSAPRIAPGATIVFEVTLLEIVQAPVPLPAP
jgi:FKBP-type peptidyl-prolyl cis-trans isomerase